MEWGLGEEVVLTDAPGAPDGNRGDLEDPAISCLGRLGVLGFELRKWCSLL